MLLKEQAFEGESLDTARSEIENFLLDLGIISQHRLGEGDREIVINPERDIALIEGLTNLADTLYKTPEEKTSFMRGVLQRHQSYHRLTLSDWELTSALTKEVDGVRGLDRIPEEQREYWATLVVGSDNKPKFGIETMTSLFGSSDGEGCFEGGRYSNKFIQILEKYYEGLSQEEILELSNRNDFFASKQLFPVEIEQSIDCLSDHNVVPGYMGYEFSKWSQSLQKYPEPMLGYVEAVLANIASQKSEMNNGRYRVDNMFTSVQEAMRQLRYTSFAAMPEDQRKHWEFTRSIVESASYNYGGNTDTYLTLAHVDEYTGQISEDGFLPSSVLARLIEEDRYREALVLLDSRLCPESTDEEPIIRFTRKIRFSLNSRNASTSMIANLALVEDQIGPDGTINPESLQTLIDADLIQEANLLLASGACPEGDESEPANLRFIRSMLTSYMTADSMNLKEITSYMAGGGELDGEMLLRLASEEKYNALTCIVENSLNQAASPEEQAFWSSWVTLDSDSRQAYLQKLNNPTEPLNYTEVNKGIGEYLEARDLLFNSKSPELRNLAYKISEMLIGVEDPVLQANNVVLVFEGNNLPEVAKRFRVFEIIYRSRRGKEASILDEDLSSKEFLSPVLRSEGNLGRVNTLYKDLLRISIDSADPSLRAYLENMIELEEAGEKLYSEENEPQDADITQIVSLISKLSTLGKLSLLGRGDNGASFEGTQRDKPYTIDEAKAALTTLKSELKVGPGQRITDRLTDMYARTLGFNNIEEILERMETAESEAAIRNSEPENVYEGKLVPLKRGDLVKGVSTDALDHILVSGSVAREFIGAEAGSDLTPYDADFLLVNADESPTVEELVTSAAGGYGDILLVVRDRGQMIQTSGAEGPLEDKVHESKRNPNKYEVFITGQITSTESELVHAGVRTGIASTEISAIIMKGLIASEEEVNAEIQRKSVFFNIANNGFYIPVFDTEGKLLFTQENYEKYQIRAVQIDEITSSESYNPQELIQELSASPFLNDLYGGPTGTELDSEPERARPIESHTLDVAETFERNFAENFPETIITKAEMRLLLALHDIGKPLAITLRNNKELQHEETRKVMGYALQATGFSDKRSQIMIELADQDMLGDFGKGGDEERCISEIKSLARMLSVTPLQVFETLKPFYISDASGYVPVRPKFLLDGESGGPGFAGETAVRMNSLAEKLKSIS